MKNVADAVPAHLKPGPIVQVETPSPFEKLKEPFPSDRVHWRPGMVRNNRGLALAYIDARDVMNRLDAVVGPENWSTEFQLLGDTMICALSIKLGGLWVKKSDGAGKTDMEGEKGIVSDALKRAAVQWGIGRYLYDLEAVWVPVDQYKKIVKPPALPDWAKPESERRQPVPQPQRQPPTQDQIDSAVEWLKDSEDMLMFDHRWARALGRLYGTATPDNLHEDLSAIRADMEDLLKDAEDNQTDYPDGAM